MDLSLVAEDFNFALDFYETVSLFQHFYYY